jgi:general stress protein YciG
MTQLDSIQNNSAESTTASDTSNTSTKKPRGFAAMDPNIVAAIARKGGRAAHASGRAHEFSHDEARAAGKKGGLAPHVTRGGPRKSKSAEA